MTCRRKRHDTYVYDVMPVGTDAFVCLLIDDFSSADGGEHLHPRWGWQVGVRLVLCHHHEQERHDDALKNCAPEGEELPMSSLW